MGQQKGFTLIELMIAVVIIGIVGSIAYPSYVTYVTQGTRADALQAIMRVANLQEQYYLDNKQYATKMKDLGLSNGNNFTTKSGSYRVKSAGTASFTITAIALGVQKTRDPACKTIRLKDTGQKTPAICWKK